MVRAFFRFGLVVVVAFGLAAACGSEDAKKRHNGDAAGAGGADEPGAGGSSVNAGAPPSDGGLAGAGGEASPVVMGGSGGEAPTSEAGAGGIVAAGGAGGDGPVEQCCQPKTCAEVPNSECTYIDDGCGNELYCGCPAGKVCGGEPTACIDCPFPIEQACELSQYLCGETHDECGRAVTCPDNCSSQSSGGTCIDGTCHSCKFDCNSNECGLVDDGCGGTIDCGSGNCDGTPCNEASHTCCVPDVQDPCAGAECGYHYDGCSYVLCPDSCDAVKESCVGTTCETSVCKPNGWECGWAFLGGEAPTEDCGSCKEGETCVDHFCVALCE